MRNYLFFFLFFVSILNVNSQNSLGLGLGKYAGISAANINPAMVNRYPEKWELTLGGGHFFVENNYAFLDKTSLLHLARNYENLRYLDSDEIPEASDILVRFKEKGPFSADVRTRVIGPAFLLRLNENMVVGFITQARVRANTKNVSEALAHRNIIRLEEDSTYNIEPFDVNVGSWAEFGLLLNLENDYYSFGVTPKYIRAMHKAYFSNNNSYTFRQDGAVHISNGQGSMSFGHTTQNQAFPSNGWGISTDLGFTIKNPFGSGSLLGVSLLDIGFIKYRAMNYSVQIPDAQQFINNNYNDIDDPDELVERLIQDGLTVDSSANVTMFTPMSIGLQMVNPLSESLTLESGIAFGIKLADRQFSSPSSVNTTLVYDRKWFSGFINASVYDLKDFRIGSAVRLGFVTIGSDHILSTFVRSENFTGSDIYFKVNVFPFLSRRERRVRARQCGPNGCYL